MIKLGLVGNPNSGKSSVFNLLTGMQQKVGNYPGVTVEVHSAKLQLAGRKKLELIDFPGAYSVHANTSDEFLLTKSLLDPQSTFYPDAILYVADIQMMDKQLLLLTQIIDLQIPVFICLSNCDQVEASQVQQVVNMLIQGFQCPVMATSTKTGQNMDQLKVALVEWMEGEEFRKPLPRIFKLPESFQEDVQQEGSFKNPYQYFLWKHYGQKIDSARMESYFGKEHSIRLQIDETLERYRWIEQQLPSLNHLALRTSDPLTQRIDRWVTHPWLGTAIFIGFMFLIFQAIFSWAQVPMDFIESGFGWLQDAIHQRMPEGWFTDLIIKGLLPGLSGVLVFIPQIALLFLLIGWMDELGYMARVVYLFDHLLRKFGLNGRSLVGLISGGACAIPAIMSTRNINNQRDRLVTMFVIPLIPCSARIPVYTALIGFVVPYEQVFGIFNTQGLAFMGLYSLGILMALLTAAIIRYFVPSEDLSYLVLQLPDYRWPLARNVWMVVYEKVKSFVVQAGTIILLISMLLWFLASFSWKGEMDAVEHQLRAEYSQNEYFQANVDSLENLIQAARLEHSFAGKIGHVIEPLFEPLGFDWKISIALITSFAAREVFVGTMSTIYSLGSSEEETLLRERMSKEVRDDGSVFYDRATSLSLLIFYAFAMQCMSTFAVMMKETRTKRWPVVQFIYMSLLAYFSSLLVYQIF